VTAFAVIQPTCAVRFKHCDLKSVIPCLLAAQTWLGATCRIYLYQYLFATFNNKPVRFVCWFYGIFINVS